MLISKAMADMIRTKAGWTIEFLRRYVSARWTAWSTVWSRQSV